MFLYTQDPKIYVQTILDVHKKYHALVIVAFSNDAGFVAALDKVHVTHAVDVVLIFWIIQGIYISLP